MIASDLVPLSGCCDATAARFSRWGRCSTAGSRAARCATCPGFWQWTPDCARQELTQAGFLDPEIRLIEVGGSLVSRVDLTLFGFDTIWVALAHPADDAPTAA